MASRRGWPRNARTGAVVLGALALAAIAAPLLATDLPWLVRTPDGHEFPAWRDLMPGGNPSRPVAGDVVLSAPIPFDPDRLDLDTVLAPPSRIHWLGTDALGRDLAARVLHGARVSLSVGLLATLLALLVGLPLGALAGYRGGRVDFLVSRLIETVLCFPTLLLVLAVMATAPGWLGGMTDVGRISLVLGATGWLPVARYVRGEFIRLRNSDAVLAAAALGGGHLRIVGRHILPRALAPVLVTAAFAVGAAIGLEAALSFLGLGVRPPVATWGGLLNEAREQIDRAWWLALFPGAALFLAVLGCNLLGEGLRDMLDPRSARPR